MGRPQAGYVRPEAIICYLCGQPVLVLAERGRLPETHKACAQFRDDCRRVSQSLALALGQELTPSGMPLEGARQLKQIWRDLQSEVTTIYNRADNPHKRRGQVEPAELAEPLQPRLIGNRR